MAHHSFRENTKVRYGGGGGSRTRVRKCYWSEAYMRSRVHAPGITLGRSRPRLRTDKKPIPLACRSRLSGPDVAGKTSPLCDVLRRPTGQAAGNGYLQLGSVCHLLIGTYRFARDFGCVHPGMPLGRKHLRRNRDAPTGGLACKELLPL